MTQPELAEDVRFDDNVKRVRNRETLEKTIGAIFSELSVDEIDTRLELAKIANGRMNSVAQFADHPQLVARDRWREFGSSVGPLKGTLPPATIVGVESRFDAVPELGEHTDQILNELGYSREIVKAWRSSGVV